MKELERDGGGGKAGSTKERDQVRVCQRHTHNTHQVDTGFYFERREKESISCRSEQEEAALRV